MKDGQGNSRDEDQDADAAIVRGLRNHIYLVMQHRRGRTPERTDFLKNISSSVTNRIVREEAPERVRSKGKWAEIVPLADVLDALGGPAGEPGRRSRTAGLLEQRQRETCEAAASEIAEFIVPVQQLLLNPRIEIRDQVRAVMRQELKTDVRNADGVLVRDFIEAAAYGSNENQYRFAAGKIIEVLFGISFRVVASGSRLSREERHRGYSLDAIHRMPPVFVTSGPDRTDTLAIEMLREIELEEAIRVGCDIVDRAFTIARPMDTDGTADSESLSARDGAEEPSAPPKGRAR